MDPVWFRLLIEMTGVLWKAVEIWGNSEQWKIDGGGEDIVSGFADKKKRPKSEKSGTLQLKKGTSPLLCGVLGISEKEVHCWTLPRACSSPPYSSFVPVLFCFCRKWCFLQVLRSDGFNRNKNPKALSSSAMSLLACVVSGKEFFWRKWMDAPVSPLEPKIFSRRFHSCFYNFFWHLFNIFKY